MHSLLNICNKHITEDCLNLKNYCFCILHSLKHLTHQMEPRIHQLCVGRWSTNSPSATIRLIGSNLLANMRLFCLITGHNIITHWRFSSYCAGLNKFGWWFCFLFVCFFTVTLLFLHLCYNMALDFSISTTWWYFLSWLQTQRHQSEMNTLLSLSFPWLHLFYFFFTHCTKH